MADKIGIMSNGKLKQWDTPYQLYHQPTNIDVARFIGTGMIIRGKVTNKQCVQLALGEFCGILPQHIQNDQEINILIRPNNVMYDDTSMISAEVLDKDFKGSYFIYTLKLDSGEIILAEIPASYNHSINSRIGIKAHLEQLVAFPI